MKKFFALSSFKTILLTGVIVISFSHFMANLFGQTIPNIVITFFKDASVAVIVTSVFLFATIWFLKTRPKNRPKRYTVIIYDIFGIESKIDGIRTEFKTHDVAWSFMKQYKISYPLYNFALVSELPESTRKTIFRYI